MGGVSAAKKANKQQLAVAWKKKDAERKRLERLGKRIIDWESEIEGFSKLLSPFRHKRGKLRTEDHHVMAMESTLFCMESALEHAKGDDGVIEDLSIVKVDNAVAHIHRMSVDNLREVRNTLQSSGELITHFGEKGKRGAGSDNYESRCLLNAEQQQYLVDYIDEQHAKGSPVVNSYLRREVFRKWGIDMARTTMSAYLDRLGLSWKPTKPRQKTFKAYRQDSIGTFLIGYDEYKKRVARGEKVKAVFTDESYVHELHCVSHSYLGKNSKDFNKKSGKGPRTIMLHAITEDGPLGMEDGKPIDALVWKQNMPNTKIDPNHPTTECIWGSKSNKGDYHSNMNSNNFYRWVTEALVPAFEKKYPGYQMVLIMDNAPYHHKRVLGSLNQLPKNELISIAYEHNVTYLDIPKTGKRYDALHDDDEDEYDGFVEDMGEYYRLRLDGDDRVSRWADVSKTAAGNRPFTPTVDELKLGLVEWLKVNRPDLLECKVEKFLKERGHIVLWTPPYCAKLQPIELFWAAGKNYAAMICWNGRKMKQTVQLVREGWYGNNHLAVDGWVGEEGDHMFRPVRYAVDCGKLVRTAEDYMNSLFIPIAKFKGTVGALEGTEGFSPTTTDMPIDMIVNLIDDDED